MEKQDKHNFIWLTGISIGLFLALYYNITSMLNGNIGIVEGIIVFGLAVAVTFRLMETKLIW